MARVVVSNPSKTRAITEAKVKTDKVDARILAQLLAAGFPAAGVAAGWARVRGVLVEAAWSASRAPGPLRAFFQRSKARRGFPTAVVPPPGR